MKVILTFFGVLLSLVLLFVSAAMNWRFAYVNLGSTEMDSHIYAAASVGADGFKALLPFFIALRWREGQGLAVLAGCFLWCVFTSWSLGSAVGFSALNRSEISGVRSREADRVMLAKADLKDAREKLARLTNHRAAGIVEADLRQLLGRQFRYKGRYQSLKELTGNCARVIGPETRKACGELMVLRAEHSRAREADHQRLRIEKARSVIDEAGGLATIGSNDPQITFFSELARTEKGVVRTALIILAAVLVEAGSGLGLFLSVGAGRRTPKALLSILGQSNEELAERYLKERVERHEDSNIKASVIHEDYCMWVRAASGGAVEPMTQTAFGRWLGKQSFSKTKINGRIYYVGLRLRTQKKVRIAS